jgi:SAM-dependent methyltransferase
MSAFDLMGKNRLEDRTLLTSIRNDVLQDIVRSRLSLPIREGPQIASRPRLSTPLLIDEARSGLKAAAPLNWPLYVECLDRGIQSYESFPPGSCSTSAHPQAELFRAFLRPYLRGHVLDVGCGPQPLPWYLSDYPVEGISGIDPISEQRDHPFFFVAGFGEYLPWEDAQFDVVVSGGSLDHYYLLDQGLKSAFRVLRPGGHFVAMITEFAGAPPYDPSRSSMAAPYDVEHLFHIDRAWFLPLMADLGYVPVEILHFELPFNYLFMSFERPAQPASV